MAKSIRSKWRRKCRAVKRVRYGEKELERLKTVLANDPLRKKSETTQIMTDIEQVANVKSASEIATAAPEDENMELEEYKKKYDRKTFRDENGTYLPWVNARKMKKRAKSSKKKKGKGKVGKR